MTVLMTHPKAVGRRMRLVATCLAALTVAFTCVDPTQPGIRHSYRLPAVNGQPVPFAFPGTGDASSTPLMMVEGWVTIVSASIAERHERLVRTIVTGEGDSVPLVSDWTSSGPYRELPGRLIVTYPSWAPGQARRAGRIRSASPAGDSRCERPASCARSTRWCESTACRMSRVDLHEAARRHDANMRLKTTPTMGSWRDAVRQLRGATRPKAHPMRRNAPVATFATSIVDESEPNDSRPAR